MVFSCLLGGSCLLRHKNGAGAPKKLGPLHLPIFHSQGSPNEGEYLVRMAIGGDPIDLVVDSCSMEFIVVGDTCGSNCQRNAGIYTQLSTTMTGSGAIIDYGSQTSYISWAQDSYSFPTALNSDFNQQLQKLNPPPLTFGVITKNVLKPFAGVEMPGTSIMGLMCVQRPGCGKGLGILNEEDHTHFINQMFGKNGIFQRSVYSIYVEPSMMRGELILGGLHDGIKGWVPLVPGSELPILYNTPQWVIRLKHAVAIGAAGNIIRDFPINYARFDTGCTYLTLPPAILKQTNNLGGIPGLAGLRFELDNGVVWLVPLDLFHRSDTEQTEDGFGGLTANDSCPDDWCVLGNELMKGMVVACDLENACLGFGGPLITVHSNQTSP